MNANWRNKRGFFAVHLLLVGLGLPGCNRHQGADHQPAAEAEMYTCPMHPQIIRNKPGVCPICGMDLVKKSSGKSTDILTTELRDLLNPVNSTVVSAIRTVYPQRGKKEVTLQLPGRVEYDPRRVHVVASRFAGRIERLFVRYNYQPVTRGQKLMEVYSPEMVTAQEELIFLLVHDPENQSLIRAARQKLSFLGLSENQVDQIAASRKPQNRLAVYSPYDGYVIEARPDSPSPQFSVGTEADPAVSGRGGMNSVGGMGGSEPGVSGGNATSQASGGPAENRLSLSEGAYVSAGQPMFRVVNTQKVWAVFQSYSEEISQLRLGQPVQVFLEKDSTQPFAGRVDLIEPLYRGGSRTASVRVYLDNAGGRLRIGQLLVAKMPVKADGGFWLPRAAVLHPGNRQVAFVKEGNTLHPVTLQTGIQSGNWVQVRSGVTEKDAVAADAQFLVDSEGFVEVGLEGDNLNESIR